MEFFATTTIAASAAELQRRLTIGALPHWCASIDKVLAVARSKSSGEILCVWGTFRARREKLRHGLRFSLPDCGNALQWTVTTGHQPDPRHTFIHLTINRIEQDRDFVDSLQQFVDDWKAGLETHW